VRASQDSTLPPFPGGIPGDSWGFLQFIFGGVYVFSKISDGKNEDFPRRPLFCPLVYRLASLSISEQRDGTGPPRRIPQGIPSGNAPGGFPGRPRQGIPPGDPPGGSPKRLPGDPYRDSGLPPDCERRRLPLIGDWMLEVQRCKHFF
jgi:hypothetical protein